MSNLTRAGVGRPALRAGTVGDEPRTERLVAATAGVTERIGDQVRETLDEVKPHLRGWMHAASAPLTLAAGIVLVALSPNADDPDRLRGLRRAQPLQTEMSSRPPTTSRNASSGIAVSVGPSAATISTKTARLLATPRNAERQSRPKPAANTMVKASTASTAHARNTAMNSAPPFTASAPGISVERSPELAQPPI